MLHVINIEKAGRAGLVAKRIQVTRGGKTYETTVYVNPSKEEVNRKREGFELLDVGTWQEGDEISLPKGKVFQIYRGDAMPINMKTNEPQRKYFRFKEGFQLRYSESFSANKKIALKFAQGIAGKYGPGYVPALITVLSRHFLVSPNFWKMEREVYPIIGREKNKIVSIEVLRKEKDKVPIRLTKEIPQIKEMYVVRK